MDKNKLRNTEYTKLYDLLKGGKLNKLEELLVENIYLTSSISKSDVNRYNIIKKLTKSKSKEWEAMEFKGVHLFDNGEMGAMNEQVAFIMDKEEHVENLPIYNGFTRFTSELIRLQNESYLMEKFDKDTLKKLKAFKSTGGKYVSIHISNIREIGNCYICIDRLMLISSFMNDTDYTIENNKKRIIMRDKNSTTRCIALATHSHLVEKKLNDGEIKKENILHLGTLTRHKDCNIIK